jgi:ribonuclease P protein component
MPETNPAATHTVGRLTRRREFLAAAGGARAHSSLITLQSHLRTESATDEPRLGMTVTRKAGGAVERNRMRRRLREALKQVAPAGAQPGYDYVVVVRRPLIDATFDHILTDLRAAFRRVHAAKQRGAKGAPPHKPLHRERADDVGEP